MGLFSLSQFDADVEKATNEKNTSEEWSLIIEVCDKIQEAPLQSKDYLKAIVKRLNHQDPHIVMQAITLLDACVNNCGKGFHLEIASREFETDLRKLLVKSQPKVSEKLRGLLKKWAEGYFKSDPQLSLIPSLYAKLRQEGMDFSQTDGSTKSKQPAPPKDPNAVSSQQEVDDIAKAIELSLKETSLSSSKAISSGSSSLYPSTNIGTPSEARKVRALYDFEAAEDNELTFFAGEIIYVLDDSDPNWWKGCNQRGDGLFPANFVTADLSVEPEKKAEAKKSVQFSETVQVKTLKPPQQVEIDEGKIDKLLYLLHEADPNEDSNDTEQMISLEEEVNAMGPLIDAELERVDRKHAQLTQLSSGLVEALNLYHTLMREPFQVAKPPSAHFHQPPSQVYNGPSYSLPPEAYLMGPPQGPGAPFPSMSHMPRPEDMGPQSLPPQPPVSQSIPYPPNGLANYGAPFPGGLPPHPPQHIPAAAAGGFPGPSPHPPPPTNGQHL